MYIPNDKFARRARREGYRARSAYKLLDIQRKFRILKLGDFVLDLGAAPGSWMQVASKIVGSAGKVLGVDKALILPLKDGSITIAQKDIFDSDLIEYILNYFGGKIDVVLSDAAPATTGLRERDQAVSLELAKRALEIALAVLKIGGNAVIKIFEGENTPQLLTQAREHFSSVKIIKPSGSQKRSREIYIVCRCLD